MKLKKVYAFIHSVLMLTACGSAQAPVQETAQESTVSEETGEELLSLADITEETEAPVIGDTFSDENFSAEKRGTVILLSLIHI